MENNYFEKGNELYFAKYKEGAIIPTKRDEDAGYDCYVGDRSKTIVIPPNKNMMIDTGIATAVSSDYFIMSADKGGMGSKNITNTAGIIDSGYRNDIFVSISNLNNEKYLVLTTQSEEEIKKCNFLSVDKGELVSVNFDNPKAMEKGKYVSKAFCIIKSINKAIAQFLVLPVPKMNTKELPLEELQAIPSERGMGKLGSTGK